MVSCRGIALAIVCESSFHMTVGHMFSVLQQPHGQTFRVQGARQMNIYGASVISSQHFVTEVIEYNIVGPPASSYTPGTVWIPPRSTPPRRLGWFRTISFGHLLGEWRSQNLVKKRTRRQTKFRVVVTSEINFGANSKEKLWLFLAYLVDCVCLPCPQFNVRVRARTVGWVECYKWLMSLIFPAPLGKAVLVKQLNFFPFFFMPHRDVKMFWGFLLSPGGQNVGEFCA